MVSMLAAMLKVVAWMVTGNNFLVLSMALALIYLNVWPLLKDTASTLGEGLKDSGSYYRYKYRSKGALFTTALQDWTVRDIFDMEDLKYRYADMNFFEILGLTVWFLALLASLYYLYKSLRRLSFWIYSRVQIAPLEVEKEKEQFMEKMRAGSHLESTKTQPKFQVEIWVRHSSTAFYKSGQGFNTQYGIYTAYHVVEDAEEVKLVRGDESLIIPAEKFERLEGDVGLYKISQSKESRLGVTRAKLSTYQVEKNSGLYVRVQAYGHATMGKLTTDDGFGLCVYDGSTVKGFSGAPYYIGNTVYGMHIGGSSVNVGFEAAYLYMLAKAGNESTEDYLLSEIERSAEEFIWQRSPYDPDEARVKFGGRYYLVDMDTVRKMNAKRTGKKVEYNEPDYEDEGLSSCSDESVPLAPRKAMAYDDSKNLIGPAAVAAGEPGKPERSQDDALKNALNVLNGIDLESRKALASCALAGQPLTLALLKDRLDSTRKSTKRRTRKNKNRAQKKEDSA